MERLLLWFPHVKNLQMVFGCALPQTILLNLKQFERKLTETAKENESFLTFAGFVIGAKFVTRVTATRVTSISVLTVLVTPGCVVSALIDI